VGPEIVGFFTTTRAQRTWRNKRLVYTAAHQVL
jgi:hypothetical protein